MTAENPKPPKKASKSPLNEVGQRINTHSHTHTHTHTHTHRQRTSGRELVPQEREGIMKEEKFLSTDKAPHR